MAMIIGLLLMKKKKKLPPEKVPKRKQNFSRVSKKSKHCARLFPPLSPVTFTGATIFTRVDRVPLLSSAECFLIQNLESCVSFLKINVFFVCLGTAEDTFLFVTERRLKNRIEQEETIIIITSCITDTITTKQSQ